MVSVTSPPLSQRIAFYVARGKTKDCVGRQMVRITPWAAAGAVDLRGLDEGLALRLLHGIMAVVLMLAILQGLFTRNHLLGDAPILICLAFALTLCIDWTKGGPL